MDQDVGERYRFLTEPALRPPPENPDLDAAMTGWRAESQQRWITRLQAECARLKDRVAELEAQVRQPAAADPDLRLLLDGVERLRARLYPPPTATAWPHPLHNQRLSPAQRRLVEDQVYAWRNPPDGARPLTHAAIAERLGVGKARVGHLAAVADARHRRAQRQADSTSQGRSARGPLP